MGDEIFKRAKPGSSHAELDMDDIDERDPKDTQAFALRGRSVGPVPTRKLEGKLKSKPLPTDSIRIYKIEGSSSSTTVKEFTLQVSDAYAGGGTKQSSKKASGYITDGEGDALDGKALESNAKVTFKEYSNGVDLYEVRAS